MVDEDSTVKMAECAQKMTNYASSCIAYCL